MCFDWMKNSMGIGFHWTSQSVCTDGRHLSYQEAVDQFDVNRFISDIVRCGAGHCLITLTHAEQYLAFPNEPLERLLPGRTAQRDLIGEIADGLHEAGVRFIAYYNHSCNELDDPLWEIASGYKAGVGGDLDAFARNICDIVAFTARRYGERLDGWWFDSGYSVDPHGPHNTISCDMGDWQFPWDQLLRAARSGNEHCAVCINAGIGSNFLYWPDQNYYPGETVALDQPFTPEEAPGIISHRFTTIDNTGWVFEDASQGFADPRFCDEAVARFVADNRAHQRMTTFNMEIDQRGVINPKSLSQFSRIRA